MPHNTGRLLARHLLVARQWPQTCRAARWAFGSDAGHPVLRDAS